MTRKAVWSILAGASLTALASGALAQAVPDQGADNQRQGLEEIVVTARRQAENLQTTPVSVSAVSEKMLERANVTQIDRITTMVPNVSIQQQSGFLGGNTAFIRGIGTQEPLLTVDSPVGIYIDGIYVGRSNAANFALVDLQRVEVLRGPQGTLFGRNTTGGAISMTTKDPSREMGGAVKLGVGNYSDRQAAVRFDTGELGGSGIAATLSYQHLQHNGYTNNPFAPSKASSPGALNSDAVWAKVKGEWGDFSATYIFDYNDLQGLPMAQQPRFLSANVRAYYTNATNGDRFLNNVSEKYKGTLGTFVNERQHVKVWGHGLTLEYGVSDAIRFKSITGFRSYRGDPLGSFYGPPGVFGPTTAGIQEVNPFLSVDKVEETDQVSQEFQILGDTGQFKYVAGLYYFKEDGSTTNPSRSTFVSSPTLATNTSSVLQFDFKAKSYAAFGQASYRPAALDDKLELTAGVRYTKDKKEVNQIRSVARRGNNTFNNTSFNAIVSYQFTDGVMSYVRYGTGYRSGGFNTRASATQNFVFLPEKAKTVEGGIKTELFDRRLRWNAAVFNTDYSNLQITQFVTTTGGNSGGFTSNAKARFSGFEAELQAVPVTGLTLSSSLGYVDAKYKVFIAPNPAAPGTFFNAADQSEFPYVPKWTGNASAQYEGEDIGFGRPLARLAYSYMSNRFFHANQFSGNPLYRKIRSGANRRVDGRVGLTEIPMGGTKVDLSAYVDNIFNKHNIISGIDFGALGFAINSYAPPRRYGLDLKVSF
ncbi:MULTISPECIES: TonB-dependent receptor [unclassified Sphingomonas]|uniref:TonB-dependent receptor n=1 Tax=unclassified Sphingomonas TaxID=196159 RepID=UPI0007022CCE|nr:MULTISPECIES: TonB-dependent receptor [unclassified Sphingomonas]KQX17466.1 ligand-gated channel protein [Sphingomonas sp. Root1294]KQY70392.1 ligand-gated channel protein [Sphingomonas sp. Root50]KRB92121.1 ligand-gated channel protein [Sphingomonas sp. Root720]